MIDPGTRRTLDELETLYDVEPRVRDVLVEGRSDVAVLRWYTSEHSLDCEIYSVDDRVEVPAETVRPLGVDINAKGRVMAVAESLRDTVSIPSLTCIVDADFDYLLGLLIDNPLLLYTDFPSLESYCLNGDTINKFLRLVVHADQTVDGSDVIERIQSALTKLFLIRVAIKECAASSRLIARFERCMSTNASGGVQVNVDEMLRRSISSRAERDAAAERYSTLRAGCTQESLKTVRGHDIARLLILVLNPPAKLSDADTLERSLLGCLETAVLDAQPMFVELRRRLAAA